METTTEKVFVRWSRAPIYPLTIETADDVYVVEVVERKE